MNQGLFVEDEPHSSSLHINNNEHKNIWIRTPAEKRNRKEKEKEKKCQSKYHFFTVSSPGTVKVIQVDQLEQLQVDCLGTQNQLIFLLTNIYCQH